MLKDESGYTRAMIVGVTGIVALIILNAALSYRNSVYLDNQASQVAHTQEVIGKTGGVLRLLVDAETGYRGFVITGDEEFLEPYRHAIDALPKRLAELKVLTKDNPQQQTRIGQLTTQATSSIENMSIGVALRRESGMEAARTRIATKAGKRRMDEIRKLVDQMFAEEDVLLEKRRNQTRDALAYGARSILISAGLGLAMVVAFVWQLDRAMRVQQKAASLIHEQKQLLHATLVSIGDAVIATDIDGRVTFMNGIAERLTGWPQAEATGENLETVFQIVNEETRNKVDNPALRALREGVIVGLANHTILISKDATERPIDDSAAPIWNEGGQINGAVLVFRDVTEQHRAIRQLTLSEARKSAILDAALDCIVSCDHEGVITEFNPASEKTFGYQRSDVVGKKLSEIIVPPSLRQRHHYGMGQYVRTGEPRILGKRIEMTGLRASGEEFPVEFSVSEIKTKGLPQFTAHLRDITDRKLAEKAADEQLRFARLHAEIGAALTTGGSLNKVLQTCADSLLRNMRVSLARIWIFDSAGQVLSPIADAGAWGEGPSPFDEVPLGTTWIGEAAAAKETKAIGDLSAHGDGSEQPWVAEHRLAACMGSPIHVNDRLLGFVAAFARHELSPSALNVLEVCAGAIALGMERAEMENKLRQYVADLSDADRRKDEFLATLAHELRNPLAPLRTGLQLISLSGQLSHSAAETRAMMERQVGQMVRLVDDLMDVSRITRGKVELRKEKVLLGDAINDAVETSRPLIEEMGHQLSIELPAQAIHLEADRMRLAQILSNLLTNSAKYMERGGRIWLSARLEGEQVVVSIKDAGIGISAEHMPYIFQMFSQIDRSLHRAQGGLGIGLSLVKRLAEMHGGSIDAHSDGVGQGAEFSLRFPVLSETSSPSLSTGTLVSPQETALRILIVDDNRDGANSLSLMLKMMGNETSVAYDGEQGLALAEEVRPDVIALDIGLPKVNGYEACSRIRGLDWGKEVTLIAITGWGQDEDRRRSQEAGFDFHLVKPVDPVAFSKLLGEISKGKK